MYRGTLTTTCARPHCMRRQRNKFSRLHVASNAIISLTHHRKMNQIERFGIRNTSSRPLQSPGNIVIHSAAMMQRDKIWTKRKKMRCCSWCIREGRYIRTLLVLFNHKYESWRLATSDWVTWMASPFCRVITESGKINYHTFYRNDVKIYNLSLIS